MGIVRWNPWNDFDALHQEFDRNFRRAVAPTGFAPATDVVETESGFELAIDLPGVKLEDVSIEIADRVLKIEGERRSEREDNDGQVRRYERSFGRFSRSFTLGAHIDDQQISAKMKDGVLIVALPKKAEVQPRKVEIQA
jgi:HSP20 family protein